MIVGILTPISCDISVGVSPSDAYTRIALCLSLPIISSTFCYNKFAMILYIGGILQQKYEDILIAEKANRIISFYNIIANKKNAINLFENWLLVSNFSEQKLLIDSGAFSIFAMKRGKQKNINIKKYVNNYCSFLKHYNVKQYTTFDYFNNYKESQRWLLYMEKKGLNPLPVYHYSDPISVFEDYVKYYDYICIGGIAAIAYKTNIKRAYGLLDTVFAKRGNSKLHCLGIHTKPILEKYPFYSFDTSIPKLLAHKGFIIYRGRQINITDRDKGPHFKDLPTKVKQKIQEEIDIEKAREDVWYLLQYNVKSEINHFSNNSCHRNEFLIHDRLFESKVKYQK